jgi:hypothetical protein
MAINPALISMASSFMQQRRQKTQAEANQPAGQVQQTYKASPSRAKPLSVYDMPEADIIQAVGKMNDVEYISFIQNAPQTFKSKYPDLPY